VITRRAVLCASSAVLAVSPAAALPVPLGNALSFRLIRHGSEIGRHTLAFETQGDAVIVRIAVTATVRLLSVPIVRYSHTAEEQWRAGRLAALQAETDKNGERQWATGNRSGDGFAVQGSQTRPYLAPDPAFATSYWNRHMLDGAMISTEDGVLLRPSVTLSRDERIPAAAGGTILADHYKLRGAFDVDLWYDKEGAWTGLAFDAADGSTVRYERL
jgi:hypothetical protein